MIPQEDSFDTALNILRTLFGKDNEDVKDLYEGNIDKLYGDLIKLRQDKEDGKLKLTKRDVVVIFNATLVLMNALEDGAHEKYTIHRRPNLAC